MSCSSLIHSYSNAKYLYRGVNRFTQSFVCGKCSSCISKKRTDWRVRCYYEALDCLSRKHGFVLFDTLTYCDKYLRKYSYVFPDLNIPLVLDKMSFCRSDVQKFFKRLRINLTRDGYHFGPEQLRYILTSEYGSAQTTLGFVNTHRPHYHVLFFVSFDIDPVVFSRHVSRAWHLGKTDGVRPSENCDECPVQEFCRGQCIYQLPSYVLDERLIRDDARSNVLKCVNYVTKYISKDMYLTTELQNNVDTLFSFLYPDYKTDYKQYRLYRRFCSQVMPFHLQSRGFGLYLLESDELDFVVRTNKVHLPTGKSDVVRSVALPRYYQRKLYYTYEKIDGRVVWHLTDRGVSSKLSLLSAQIASFCQEYRLFDSSIPSDKLYQLALYNCVYRGTLSDYQSLLLPYREYYRRLITPHDLDEDPLYYNFGTVKDRLITGRFLCTRYSVSPDGDIIYHGKQLHKEFIPFDGYVLVDDKVCLYWYGFDRRLAAYEKWSSDVGLLNDAVMMDDDVHKDYYRSIGLLKS